jgi:hypothetical protein
VTAIAPDHISQHLRELLIDAFSADDLQHIVAAMRARDHVPGPLAAELANELAEILSADPMETEVGTIHNRPTVGWHLRRARLRPRSARS